MKLSLGVQQEISTIGTMRLMLSRVLPHTTGITMAKLVEMADASHRIHLSRTVAHLYNSGLLLRKRHGQKPHYWYTYTLSETGLMVLHGWCDFLRGTDLWKEKQSTWALPDSPSFAHHIARPQDEKPGIRLPALNTDALVGRHGAVVRSLFDSNTPTFHRKLLGVSTSGDNAITVYLHPDITHPEVMSDPASTIFLIP